MNSYLYLTIQGHVWIDEMLSGWRNSRKRFFCFPWVRFNVKTLKPNEFWLYLYYSQRKTPLQSLAGKIKYRVHVVDWQRQEPFTGPDVYCVREDEDGKVWFRCKGYEELEAAGGLLSLHDLEHRDGKSLISTMRNSIPPVVLSHPEDVSVIRTH